MTREEEIFVNITTKRIPLIIKFIGVMISESEPSTAHQLSTCIISLNNILCKEYDFEKINRERFTSFDPNYETFKIEEFLSEIKENYFEEIKAFIRNQKIKSII